MGIAQTQKLTESDPAWHERLKKIVARALLVEKNIVVYVFGSYAEGRFTSSSDLDIAIVIPDNLSVKDFYSSLFSAGPLSDWPLDLLIFKKSDFDKKKEIGGVCFDIRESGLEIYPKWQVK